MSIYQPTWLYIKQHNQTGLKYFGKTIQDPYKYPGSGLRWTRHIRKHGDDVSTIWCKLFSDKDELIKFAIKFSEENNIVESKEWANLKIENGTTGGAYVFTADEKARVSKAVKDKQWSGDVGDTRRKVLSEQLRGSANHMAKRYKITKPDGSETIITCLKQFCRDTGLIWNTVRDNVGKGVICRKGPKDTSFYQSYTKRAIEGWRIDEVV